MRFSSRLIILPPNFIERKWVFKVEEMSELKSIIRNVQDGDLHAFGFVVRRFHDMAVGYAHSILGDFHLAEDASQEAFVQAFSKLHQLSDPAASPGWFRRILIGCCDRIRRKKVSTVPLDVIIDMPSQRDSPYTTMEMNEIADHLHNAIGKLPEAQRVVTSLFYITGYSGPAIGEFLGISHATVRHRLFAARKNLKEMVSDLVDDLPEEEPTHTYQGAHLMFKSMFPELHVSNVEVAATFFERALGFKRGFTYEEDDELDFAVMSHGSMTLYLHHMLPKEEAGDPRRARLYFEPTDIVGLRADLRNQGYDISELEDQPYGATTCVLQGPDRYEVFFQQWKPK